MENVEKNLARESRKKLMQALRGWRIWYSLVRRYDMKSGNAKTVVVLLPQYDDEACYFALLYLDRMLSLRKMNAAVLLTVSSDIIEIAPIFSKKILAIEIIDNQVADSLLQYYELMMFDERFIAASLDEPNGRNGRALVGISNITVEELVAIGIYRIIPYVQKKRPVYNGENPCIKKFMRSADTYSGRRTDCIIQ